MIDITVKVPEDRVGEFYSMFGAWLNGSAQEPSLSGNATAKAARNCQPWSDSDTTLAAAIWDKFSDTAKSLFSTLIDEPGRQFDGEELSELLSIRNGRHGVAGVLAWPGRHCVKVDRKWPWSFDYPDGETAVYWFTPENAALFAEARDRQG